MRNLEIFLVASFLVLTSGETDVGLKYVAIIKCSEVEPCVGTIISPRRIITEKTCYCPDKFENLYTVFHERQSVYPIEQYDENAAALYIFDELSAPMISIRSTPVNQEDDLFCYIPLVPASGTSTPDNTTTYKPVTWRLESGSICVNEHIPHNVLSKGTPLICNDLLVAFQTQEEGTCQRFENITKYIDFLQRVSGEKDENVKSSNSDDVISNDESDHNSNENLKNTSSSLTVIKELFPVCVILVLTIYNK